MRSGEIAAPAIGDDQPGTEPAPGFHVLATVGNDSAVGLADGDGVASDLHGEVAGGLHADGFQAQVLDSGIPPLAIQSLDLRCATSWDGLASAYCTAASYECTNRI